MNVNAYDFKLIKSCIDGFQQLIDSVYIGIEEEWFYTAEPIFEDGEYLRDISTEDRRIGGVSGSPWGTPILLIRFKDGTEAVFDCGTVPKDKWDSINRPMKVQHKSADWLINLPRFQLLNTQPQLEQLTDDQATT